MQDDVSSMSCSQREGPGRGGGWAGALRWACAVRRREFIDLNGEAGNTLSLVGSKMTRADTDPKGESAFGVPRLGTNARFLQL